MTEYTIPEVTDRDVYVTRSFDATVDVVWKFWTQPELLAQWFGPHGTSVPVDTVKVEAQDGGSWRVQFHDHGDKTRITLHQCPFTPEFRDMTRDGWNESFVKLDTIFARAEA